MSLHSSPLLASLRGEKEGNVNAARGRRGDASVASAPVLAGEKLSSKTCLRETSETPAVVRLLQTFGSATLSTTNKLVLTPSLQFSQNVLLPSLVMGLSNLYSTSTPQRLQDWLTILQSSLLNCVTVLLNTQRGKHACADLHDFLGDSFFDVLVSDLARQSLVDLIVSYLKLVEALRTPEFKQLLRHLPILTCRILDLFSSGKTKLLIHHFYDLLWSFVQLLADPATTLALAEVTAHACHALEMEHSIHKPLSQRKYQIKKKRRIRLLKKIKRRQKRRKRDQYNLRTYGDKILIVDADENMKNKHGSVEDAFLSSLGEAPPAATQQHVPTKVICPSQLTLDDDNDAADIDDDLTMSSSVIKSTPATTTQSGLPNQPKPDIATETSDDDEEKIKHQQEKKTTKIVKSDCNVSYLRESISNRAARRRMDQLEQQQQQQQQQQQEMVGPPSSSSSVSSSQSSSSRVDVEDLGMYHNQRKQKTALTVQQHKQPKMQSKVQPKKLILDYDDQDEKNKNDDSKKIDTAVNNDQDEKGWETVEEDDDDNDDNNDVADNYYTEGHFLSQKNADGSSAVSQFYKTLDEITSNKRNDVINTMLLGIEKDIDDDDNDDDNNSNDNENNEEKRKMKKRKQKSRCWYPRAAAAAGAGNERGQDTLRWIVSAVEQAKKETKLKKEQQEEEERFKIGLGKDGRGDHAKRSARGGLFLGTKEKRSEADNKKALLIGVLLLIVLFFVLVWFGLGCYGLYILLFGSSSSSSSLSASSLGAKSFPPPAPPQSEIVIKIVREVVHVNSDGSSAATCFAGDDTCEQSETVPQKTTKEVEEERVAVQDALVTSAVGLSPEVAEAVANSILEDEKYN